MHPENFYHPGGVGDYGGQLASCFLIVYNKPFNGRLSAIIFFNMRNIWKTAR